MRNMMPHARSTRDDLATPSVPPQVGSTATGTAPVPAQPEGGYFRSHGPLIVTLGYDIVPIKPGTKSPGITGWGDRDFNHESPRAWHRYGLGVKTGRPNADGHAVICVDIDVADEAVVGVVIAWLGERFGETPQRIGRAPRTLLPFRALGSFCKIQSAAFRSSDGETHRIEVLGKGQQFLSYAIHPSTGLPYAWPGAELVDTPLAKLPEITEQQVFALLEYFESIVPPDWERVARETVRRVAAEPHQRGKHQQAPIWKLRLALDVIPIDPETYDRWVRVGMSLHNATGGSAEGFELWDQWSRKGRKYDGSTRTKWETFR